MIFIFSSIEELKFKSYKQGKKKKNQLMSEIDGKQ